MGGSFHSHLTIVKPISKEAGFVVGMNTDNTMNARQVLPINFRYCPANAL